jgi:hypothetical protein
MNKGEILVAIHNMRGEYAHKTNEDLKRIGKAALEGAQVSLNPSFTRAYYEAQAKVAVLDELLEKIDNTLEDTGTPAEEKKLCTNQWLRDLTEGEVKSLNNIFYDEKGNN